MWMMLCFMFVNGKLFVQFTEKICVFNKWHFFSALMHYADWRCIFCVTLLKSELKRFWNSKYLRGKLREHHISRGLKSTLNTTICDELGSSLNVTIKHFKKTENPCSHLLSSWLSVFHHLQSLRGWKNTSLLPVIVQVAPLGLEECEW